MSFGRFELHTDLSPASWVQEHLVTFAEGVRSLVPENFETYARVLHPASLREEPVSWEAVAQHSCRTMHPLAQFGSLTGIHQWEHRGPEEVSVWDEPPEEGSLPRGVGTQLVDLLRPQTTTPDRCWFGSWVGWGDVRFPQTAPQFRLPGREYFLLSGAIEAIAETVGGGRGSGKSVAILHRRRRWPFRWRRPQAIAVQGEGSLPFSRYQSASLWWPEDRAWFLATEIDLNSTYVGGSRAAIDAIMASPHLESHRVSPDDPIDLTADSLNPAPSKPS